MQNRLFLFQHHSATGHCSKKPWPASLIDGRAKLLGSVACKLQMLYVDLQPVTSIERTTSFSFLDHTFPLIKVMHQPTKSAGKTVDLWGRSYIAGSGPPAVWFTIQDKIMTDCDCLSASTNRNTPVVMAGTDIRLAAMRNNTQSRRQEHRQRKML